ncbi:phosphotriesterase family protein [Nesterenkonia sp. K-15-9-6]|uniref:phosphotriesterase family protein n=1 Tax=Nesterenkonia sp. K-15-9-6 TaxID=3093918 RepID=UPI0040442A07
MSRLAAGLVETVTGAVPGEQLGTTLVHEHLFVGDPQLARDLPHPEWEESTAVDEAVDLLTRLAALGVDSIVDLTVPGLGRDVRLIQEVARRAPVRVLAATGWYTMDALPPFFHLNGPGRTVDGPDPLVELFRRDVTDGIAGTGVRAAIIKVASGARGLTEDVARVFAAAATVHRATGVPIITHSDPATRSGIEQQRLLRDLDVSMDSVVIGHAGDCPDGARLRRLAQAGSFLGFDRFGMAHTGDDEDRLRRLLDLLEAGYDRQLLLSQDAAVFSRVTPPSWRQAHAPSWRMDHLHTEILPRLRRLGVDSRLEHQLLVENPRRLLAGRRDGSDNLAEREGRFP